MTTNGWTCGALTIFLAILLLAGCKDDYIPPETGFTYDALPSPFFPLCYNAIDDEAYRSDPLRRQLQVFFTSARYEMLGGHLDTALARLNMAGPIISSGIPPGERPSWEAALFTHKAYLHTRRKELPLARAYAHRAIFKAEKGSLPLLIDANIALANVEYQFTHFDEAFTITSYLQDSLISGPVYPLQMDAFYQIRGNCLKYRADNSRSVNTFNRHLADFVRHCGDRPECLAAYHKLYGTYLYVNYINPGTSPDSLQSAVYHMQEAVDLQKTAECSNSYSIAESYELLSFLQSELAKYDAALASNKAALNAMFGPGYDMADLSSDQVSIQLVTSKSENMLQKAYATGDTSLAADAFFMLQRVDTLFDNFNKYDRDTYLHNNFFNDFYYLSLISYCAEKYNNSGNTEWLEQLLIYIDNYRSKSLRRDRRLQKLWNSGDEHTIALVRPVVQNDIELEGMNLEWSREPHQGPSFLEKYCDLIEERTALFEELKGIDPELYTYMTRPQVDITDILERSRTDQVARIYYYKGATWYNKDFIYCLVILDGDISFYPITDGIDSLAEHIDRLGHWHKNRRNTIPGIQEYSILSHALFKTLVSTYWDKVKNATSLRIVPDQELTNLSFGALITHLDTSVTHFKDLEYVVTDIPVSYSYTIEELPGPAIADDANVLATAMSWTDRKTLGARHFTERAELPGAIDEMTSFSKAMGKDECRIFTGYACTLDRFEKFGPRSEVLHLAVHGQSLAQGRLGSKLFFRKGKQGENTLYTSELMYKGIDPDLVLLSACETGAGLLQGEEGAFSVSRSFIIAGARNVISSTWLLSDLVARDIFREFYLLYPEQNAVSALATAQRVYLARSNPVYAFPGFWAPLVIQQ